MPMLTAAAQAWHAKDESFYELPKQLRNLAESAWTAKLVWEQLDDFLTQTYRDYPQDYHDARVAEQSAYNAWQAVELAYQQIVKRIPAKDVPDTAVVFAYGD